MKFTNDIKFNKPPMSNRLLKIVYSGELFKNNSSEVSIVYGFGENWENTTEQKMYKTSYGFCYTILIENYNTFNFCFKNEQNIWDNNNNFNYIAPIEISNNDSIISQVSDQEVNKIVNENIDNIVNAIDIDFSNQENVQTIESKEDSELLDSLVNDLFEEYGFNNTKETNKEISEAPSLSSDIDEKDKIFTKIEEELNNKNKRKEISEEENFKEMSKMFNDLIDELQTPKSIKLDVGNEIENLFNNTFTDDFVTSKNTDENYIPLTDDVNLETEEKNSDITISNEKTEKNIFDFEDLDFDFSIPNNLNVVEKPRDFSDSFYDDQDISTHDYLDFQQIVDSTISDLNKETASVNEAFDEEFKKQSEEFDKAISEYSEYFDSLIEEIISSPTTSLSKSVSNEEVFEKEQNQLVVSQTENTAIAKVNTNTDLSADGVSQEYALYDYKSYSFLYMIKRRFKMLVSTIFNKIPKIFGRQPNIDEK